MDSRPTSLTTSCETSISLGTGCLHLSAGWPSAFFPSALLIVRRTKARYGGMDGVGIVPHVPVIIVAGPAALAFSFAPRLLVLSMIQRPPADV